MKIAVVGAGAVGSYYGAMLARAGENVHFLLRSDYEAVKRDGLAIRSRRGDFHLQPNVYRTTSDIGPSDLVLIALKSTANDVFGQLLPPLVHADTMLLTLQNGLGNEELLASIFPARQVLGGLCFVCLNRIAPGTIHHLEHGLIKLGEFGRPALPRTHDIAARFQRAGVPCEVTDDLARAHWEKLVWNIPFNGLGVAAAAGLQAVLRGQWQPADGRHPCLTTDRLLADPQWTTLVRELMREVISTARKLGMNLEYEVADAQIDRTRSMGAYRASTLIDFERGHPLELNSLFLEPLKQAKAAGAATPRLVDLCRVLEALDRARAADRGEHSAPRPEASSAGRGVA
jgi:2-dehydropantoate 2-reductase